VGNPLDALYTAVGWVFTHIYDLWKPLFGATSGWTWALSIIMLVVLMRLIMVPLFIKQMHTTRAMSALQPQMMALRKKYGNDKQTLNQEMMKLYQEAGVNPLMGCLPLVLQLPLFFSLFEVLKAIAAYKPGSKPAYGLPQPMVSAAHSAQILGAHIWDKVLFTGTLHVPLHAKIVILIAVLISMTTTYMTIKQSMKRGMMPAATPDNPMANSQKYMMYIMPLFALTGLYWEFGLVLYWVTTNIWTLGQQGLLARRYPYTPPAASGTSTDTRQGAVGAAAPKASNKVTSSAAKPLVSGSTVSGGSGRGAAAPAKGGSTASRGGAAASRGSSSARGPATKQQPNQARPGPSRAANASANGAGAADGKPTAAGGGMLGRLGRGRSTPEPEPQEPEVKLVRHQTARQSRSKRSGKR
jgi:YidC/Oxa1 family membrane protein insertase